jgi:hypothetical protein
LKKLYTHPTTPKHELKAVSDDTREERPEDENPSAPGKGPEETILI